MSSRPTVLVVIALLGLLFTAAPAFAYNEGGSADPSRSECASCHGGDFSKGPHGGYTVGTNKCQTCHAVHAGDGGSSMLLPKPTVTGTCETCHDGTGGGGVYGAIAARGLSAAAAHRVDTTATVPAGDAETGGSAQRQFSGAGGTLGCNDCHSPHDAGTVAPFAGDRMRTADSTTTVSNRLLRRTPGGTERSVARYGSEWCGACHEGAAGQTASGHNHPVETTETAGSYAYDSLPSVASSTSTDTTLAALGGSNAGYLMPDPRTPLQQGHAPLCQQCHEDSRDVGGVGSVTPFSVTSPDGRTSTDNPRFQGFPHEAVNAGMLVETGDDLCTNCHAPAQLP